MKHLAWLALLALLAGAPALGADPFLRRTTTVEVVEKVGPAVVNITTEQLTRASPFGSVGGDPFFNRFFRDFFEPRARSAQNLGSGVLIDARGHVLTNAHVVARANRIRVTTSDGREFDATLIGADPNNDIAVLSIDAEETLPWIAPGRSDDLMVGEPVIAIGNPFGLSNTVTTGVISALGRSLRTEDRVFHGFLQTDASINPGNSGGPLLNARGELVGINTAIYRGGEGIGFAIPVDAANRIVAELIEHGEVAPVWVGLSFQDLTPELLEALELPPKTQGALVNAVRRKSPAAAAGLHRGDVLTHLDGHAVGTAREFFEILGSVTDEQVIELEVYREGTRRKVGVEAREVPEDLVMTLADEMLGVQVRPRERGGFLVEEVRSGSGAHRIGVQSGDLLLGINGRTLADDQAFRRSVLDLRGRTQALVVVQRGSGRYHVTIPLV